MKDPAVRIREAFRYVTLGLMAWTPPPELHYSRKDTMTIAIATDTVVGQLLEILPNGMYAVLGRYGYVLRSASSTKLETV